MYSAFTTMKAFRVQAVSKILSYYVEVMAFFQDIIDNSIFSIYFFIFFNMFCNIQKANNLWLTIYIEQQVDIYFQWVTLNI